MDPEQYREPFPESLPDDWGPTKQEREEMVARIKARRAAEAQAQALAQAAPPKSGNDHLNLSQAPTEPEVYQEPFPESLPDDWELSDQEVQEMVARVKARREKEALA